MSRRFSAKKIGLAVTSVPEAKVRCPEEVRLRTCIGVAADDTVRFCFASDLGCTGTGVVLSLDPPSEPFSVTRLRVQGALGTRTIGPAAFPLTLLPGESLLVEPYVTSQGQLVASISVPVKVEGAVVGVAGVDIRLSGLATVFAALQPFEGGRVLLLSNARKWIVPPQSDLLMKDYDGIGAPEVTAALADGRPRTLRGSPDGSVRLVYPFTQPGMNTTWPW